MHKTILPTRKAIAGWMLLVLVSTAVASPALADPRGRDCDDRHGWHDRGHDHGWRRAPVPRRPYVERDIYVNRYYAPVYRSPRTVIVENQYAPSSITCTTRYNPLPGLVGGVGGGVIGAQVGKGHGRTAAIITGALLGGAVGSQYTYTDQVCTRRVFETAEVGRPLYWDNPDTGYQYTVTPVRDYRTDGRYCREYTATARVGGRLQETYGTACYQPDGSWEIIN